MMAVYKIMTGLDKDMTLFPLQGIDLKLWMKITSDMHQRTLTQ